MAVSVGGLCSAVFLFWILWYQHLLDMCFYLKMFSQLVGKRWQNKSKHHLYKQKCLHMCCNPAELSCVYYVFVGIFKVAYTKKIPTLDAVEAQYFS